MKIFAHDASHSNITLQVSIMSQQKLLPTSEVGKRLEHESSCWEEETRTEKIADTGSGIPSCKESFSSRSKLKKEAKKACVSLSKQIKLQRQLKKENLGLVSNAPKKICQVQELKITCLNLLKVKVDKKVKVFQNKSFPRPSDLK